MSTKRSPSEIPLSFGVRTVGEAIQELSLEQLDANDQQTEDPNNWNENSNASNGREGDPAGDGDTSSEKSKQKSIQNVEKADSDASSDHRAPAEGVPREEEASPSQRS